MNLKCSNLTFSYGKHEVLSGLNMSLDDGDVMAVLGPNGVGKSTLFKCLLGFLKGYGGTVEIDGVDARTLSSKELAKKIAYIPQSSKQVFNFSVLELVEMGMATRLKAFEQPGKDHEQEALEVLDSLGIVHLAHRGCGNISGGEYQLVLLARALVQQARILIMDEPTAALDYGNQYRIMEKIGGLVGRNYAVMLSAHDPNQVMMHANRVMVIEGGRVSADGTPVEVMTPEVLSRLYGITVNRATVDDRGRKVELCYPAGPSAADLAAAGRGAGAGCAAKADAGAAGAGTAGAGAAGSVNAACAPSAQETSETPETGEER